MKKEYKYKGCGFRLAKIVILAILFNGVQYALKKPIESFVQTCLFQCLAFFPKDSEKLPIIVNISHIHPDKTKPTDRARLDAVVQAVRNAGASAIGIDLDFSNPYGEEKGGPIPEDMFYLAKWAAAENIRVGVWHRAAYGRQEWLGILDFANVAAGIALPSNDRTQAFFYSKAVRSSDRLIQMPAALWALNEAKDCLDKEQCYEKALQDLYSRILIISPKNTKMEFGEYAIDFSYAKKLYDDRIEFINPDELNVINIKRHINHRQVLIGDLDNGEDKVVDPGSMQAISGLLVHACSLATLNEGLLREWGPTVSWLLDAIILVGSLVLACLLNKHLAKENIELFISWCAAVGVVLFGILGVLFRWIFWPDCIWMSATFFLSPIVEKPFFKLIYSIRNGLKTVFTTFVRDEEEHINE